MLIQREERIKTYLKVFFKIIKQINANIIAMIIYLNKRINDLKFNLLENIFPLQAHSVHL